jgi:hypothetical protein
MNCSVGGGRSRQHSPGGNASSLPDQLRGPALEFAKQGLQAAALVCIQRFEQELHPGLHQRHDPGHLRLPGRQQGYRVNKAPSVDDS